MARQALRAAHAARRDRARASPPRRPSHGELRIVVDEFLDAGEALVVDVDKADHVARGGAHRIDAAIFLDEGEARQAELVDLGLLLRRQLALDADEAALRPSARERRSLALTSGSTLVTCSTSSSTSMTRCGIGIESCALDVGREQPAAAIEDVGTMHRRGNVVEPAGARPAAGEAERHEAAADQDEGQRKGEAGETEAVTAAGEIGPLGAGCGGI